MMENLVGHGRSSRHWQVCYVLWHWLKRWCWLGAIGAAVVTPSVAWSQSFPGNPTESRPTSRPTSTIQPTPSAQPEMITVYVPYQKLGSVLQQGGVFLSRPQFDRLMKEAQQLRKIHQHKMPVSYVLTQARYEGTIKNQVLRLKVVMEVQVLADTLWTPITLPFSGLPMLSAQLNDKPAMILSPGGEHGGYVVLVKGRGVHRLVLQFAGSVYRVSQGYEWKMQVPSTPQTQLDLQWDGGEWQVHLFGQAVTLSTTKSATSSRLETSVGPRRLLEVRWQPKQRLLSSEKRLVSGRIYLESTVGQSMVQTQARVNVRIVRGKLQQLRLALPSQHKLIAVEAGTLIKNWSIVSQKGQRILWIELRQAMEGSFSIRLELEQLLNEQEKQVIVPVLSLLDAKWQHGWIALRTDGAIQLHVLEQQGLTQIDPEEYARQVRSSSPALAFAYLQASYTLRISLQSILPRLRTQVTHRMVLEEKRAMLTTTVSYQIERAGVFRLQFLLPKEWKLREVRCPSMRDHFIEQQKLVVVLKQKLGGPVLARYISPHRLWTFWRRELGEFLYHKLAPHHSALRQKILRRDAIERLQVLMGQAEQRSSGRVVCQIQMDRDLGVSKNMHIPLIQPLDVESERGTVAIFVPDSLELETTHLKGLISMDDLSPFAHEVFYKHRIRQGFRYVGHPISGTLEWRRKETSVEADIWQPVKMQDDGYRVDGVVQYRIRFAETQQIKLAVPVALVPNFRVITETRETRKTEGKKFWEYTFLLHRQVQPNQTFNLQFTYQVGMKKSLEVGSNISLALSSVHVPGAIRQTSYWGLQKEENISLHIAASAGYERIDSSDLPNFAKGEEMARMMRTRVREPETVQVVLRKHKYAQVLASTITRMHVDMAISLDGEVHVLAVAQILNRGRQFLPMRLPAGAQVLALRVAGRNRYRFELNRKGELLIDLHYRSKGRPFWIVVRYKHTLPKQSVLSGGWGKLPLRGPEVLDTPVLHTSLELFLPPRYSYVAFASSMLHEHNRKDLWTVLRELLWARRYSSLYQSHDVYTVRSQAGDLSSQFPRRGLNYAFASDHANVEVVSSFRHSSLQSLWEYVIALLVFVTLLWLRRRDDSLRHALYLWISAVLSVVFLGAILPDSWVAFSYSALLGTLGAGGLWVAAAIWYWFRWLWSQWRSVVSVAQSQRTPSVQKTETTPAPDKSTPKPEEGA